MKRRERALFLERDGVLNRDRGDVVRPEDFEWLPGATRALQLLQQAGWRLVLTTNQPGIARGLFGPAEYENLTAWIRAELAQQGVALDGVHHCPHLPDAPLAAWRRQCDCHLPSPGMLRRAARDLGLDLKNCVMVSARSAGIQAGRTAGVAACVRIAAAEGAAEQASDASRTAADAICASLSEAADWVLSHESALHA